MDLSGGLCSLTLLVVCSWPSVDRRCGTDQHLRDLEAECLFPLGRRPQVRDGHDQGDRLVMDAKSFLLAVDRRCGTDGFPEAYGSAREVSSWPSTAGAGRTSGCVYAVRVVEQFPLGRRPQVRDGPCRRNRSRQLEAVSSWPSTAGAGRTRQHHRVQGTRQVSSWPSTAGAGRTTITTTTTRVITMLFPLGRRPQVRDGQGCRRCNPGCGVSSWPSTAGAGRTCCTNHFCRSHSVSSWPSTAGAGRTVGRKGVRTPA